MVKKTKPKQKQKQNTQTHTKPKNNNKNQETCGQLGTSVTSLLLIYAFILQPFSTLVLY